VTTPGGTVERSCLKAAKIKDYLSSLTFVMGLGGYLKQQAQEVLANQRAV